MDHHVLHVGRENRVPVLVDLTSAPGRTVIFTRTKHGAKALTRQLNKSGVPAIELHGNLSQNARTRNMEAFHSGKAATLVATDIAARGIHVDDVALVIHADPPTEHKAYLHRSGRTARAGAAGTVITMMTDDQVRDVRQLTRAAGIKPTTTKIDSNRHPLLAQLAPGERVSVVGGIVIDVPAGDSRGSRSSRPAGSGGGGGRNRSRRSGGGGGGGRGGQGSGKGGQSARSGSGSASAPASGSGGNGGNGGNRGRAPKRGGSGARRPVAGRTARRRSAPAVADPRTPTRRLPAKE